MICKHPPSRYYSGTYWHPVYGNTLWLGCCDCGKILGEKILDRNYTQMDVDMDTRILMEELEL